MTDTNPPQSDDTDESPVIRDLRKQINDLSKRNRELEQQQRSRVLGDVLGDYGLDPNKGPGKLVAAHYDGDLDADAVREWLTNEGFETATGTVNDEPAEPSPRQQAQARMDQLRSTGTPSQGQRMSFDEFKHKAATDPQAAAEAKAAGLVDFPPHIQQAM